MDGSPQVKEVTALARCKVMPQASLVTGKLNLEALAFMALKVADHKGLSLDSSCREQMAQRLTEPAVQALTEFIQGWLPFFWRRESLFDLRLQRGIVKIESFGIWRNG
jgi:hypothetical protein